jgi:phosphonate transport system permease protein
MWDRSVGGGIGFLLVQYINLLQFHQAGTAIWAIAIVVIIMDWASARIRARVI